MDVTEAPSRQADRRPPQGARRSRRVSPRVKRVVALVSVLLGWEALSRAGVVDPFYAPPSTEVADVLRELFATGDIYRHLQATFTAALGELVLERLAAGDPAGDALTGRVTDVLAVTTGRLNLLLIDGTMIAATAVADTLCWRTGPAGTIVASEPSDDGRDWHEVPDGRC